MADIDVVPKNRSNVWLWVVLAIIAIAAMWVLAGRNEPDLTTWKLPPAAQIAEGAGEFVQLG
jgi:hypothetical protein